jgi:hypothetical protein
VPPAGPRQRGWRWTRLLPADKSWRDWFLWLLGFVVAPAMAVFLLVVAGPDLGDAWSAAHGGGLLGTLHVNSVECGRAGCSLDGGYTSQSGDTRVPHVHLDADPHGAGVGSDVPVRYFPGHVAVYTSSGSHEWIIIAVLLLASAVGLVVWTLTVCARGLGIWLPWMDKPVTAEDIEAKVEAEYARRRNRNQHPGPVRRRHHRRT